MSSHTTPVGGTSGGAAPPPVQPLLPAASYTPTPSYAASHVTDPFLAPDASDISTDGDLSDDDGGGCAESGSSSGDDDDDEDDDGKHTDGIDGSDVDCCGDAASSSFPAAPSSGIPHRQETPSESASSQTFSISGPHASSGPAPGAAAVAGGRTLGASLSAVGLSSLGGGAANGMSETPALSSSFAPSPAPGQSPDLVYPPPAGPLGPFHSLPVGSAPAAASIASSTGTATAAAAAASLQAGPSSPTPRPQPRAPRSTRRMYEDLYERRMLQSDFVYVRSSGDDDGNGGSSSSSSSSAAAGNASATSAAAGAGAGDVCARTAPPTAAAAAGGNAPTSSQAGVPASSSAAAAAAAAEGGDCDVVGMGVAEASAIFVAARKAAVAAAAAATIASAAAKNTGTCAFYNPPKRAAVAGAAPAPAPAMADEPTAAAAAGGHAPLSLHVPRPADSAVGDAAHTSPVPNAAQTSVAPPVTASAAEGSAEAEACEATATSNASPDPVTADPEASLQPESSAIVPSEVLPDPESLVSDSLGLVQDSLSTADTVTMPTVSTSDVGSPPLAPAAAAVPAVQGPPVPVPSASTAPVAPSSSSSTLPTTAPTPSNAPVLCQPPLQPSIMHTASALGSGSSKLRFASLPRAVLVIKKPNNATVTADMRTLCSFLAAECGLTVFAEPAVIAAEPALAAALRLRPLDPASPGRGIDFSITLGGDGTVLHYNSLFKGSRPVPPVVSFALGSLGFLTPFPFSKHREVLCRILEGARPPGTAPLQLPPVVPPPALMPLYSHVQTGLGAGQQQGAQMPGLGGAGALSSSTVASSMSSLSPSPSPSPFPASTPAPATAPAPAPAHAPVPVPVPVPAPVPASGASDMPFTAPMGSLTPAAAAVAAAAGVSFPSTTPSSSAAAAAAAGSVYVCSRLRLMCRVIKASTAAPQLAPEAMAAVAGADPRLLLSPGMGSAQHAGMAAAAAAAPVPAPVASANGSAPASAATTPASTATASAANSNSNSSSSSSSSNNNTNSSSSIVAGSGGGVVSGVYHPLNEAVIQRGLLPSMAQLELFIDGHFVTTVRADGLIIATPTGSTGYSMSSGGPMLAPSTPSIVITPLCPHNLSFRPVVVCDSTLIRVRVPADANPATPVFAAFDGRHTTPLGPGDSVQISMSHVSVPSIVFSEFNTEWFRSIKHKLHWNKALIDKPPVPRG